MKTRKLKQEERIALNPSFLAKFILEDSVSLDLPQERYWRSPETQRSARNVPLTEEVETMLREKLRAQDGVDLKAHIFPENWNRRAVSQQFNRVLNTAENARARRT